MTTILAAALAAAAEPADAIKFPAERAAFDALAARFAEPPGAAGTKGKGTTIALRKLKANDPRNESATASFAVDAAGHVVAVTANRAAFTNDEFRHFAAFAELTALTLWHNYPEGKKPRAEDYDGTGLAKLTKLARLEKVTLAGGWLNDDGMAAAAKLPRLKDFQVWHCRFTDAGVAALRGHPTLEAFKAGPMWRPDLTDKALEALAACPRLRHVRLNETVLTWDGGLRHLAARKDTLKLVELSGAFIEPADVDKLRAAVPAAKVEWSGLGASWRVMVEKGAAYPRKAATWMPKELLARAEAEAARKRSP